MAARYSDSDVEHFYVAAESLRKYRRAELVDDETGETLIDQLYCDPLPGNGAISRLNQPNSTLLVGRKGTGKSTLFQKLQYDTRKRNDRVTAYVDIKTIFESSSVDIDLLAKISKIEGSLPQSELTRLLLHRAFLTNVVQEIVSELDKKLSESMWERIKNSFSGKIDALKSELHAFTDSCTEDQFVRVLGVKTVQLRETSGAKKASSAEAAASVSATDLGLSAKGLESAESTKANEAAYTDILINVFEPAKLIRNLQSILQKSGLRHLYLLIDDFSELPLDAMRVVVDVLLAPLNNLSNEFVKLKIAAYPGRIYLGNIDKTKIDELYLDLYRLYGTGDITRLEESGVDFTRRLLTQRLTHFCSGDSQRFFDRSFDEVLRQLFFASLCNPRILGHLLIYLHETAVSAQRPVGVRLVQEAARRFYEEKVESYFHEGRFLQEAFSERSSIFSLKELLESFVNRARELKRHASQVFQRIPGLPPTSHFHLPSSFESLLQTLELNFFVTKYFEMNDRDGRKVSIFALNYGLCEKYSVAFGRPTGEREFRLYFVERVFDYSSLVMEYLKNNQEIVCETCEKRYEHADLEKLQFYKMKCPACASGICRVTNLSRKYESELQAVNDNLLLPRTELGILQALDEADRPLRAGEIAVELDCSHQLVGRRAKNLEDRGLVLREQTADGRKYSVTTTARTTYFSDRRADDLRVEDAAAPTSSQTQVD